jgi:hypothetical protein
MTGPGGKRAEVLADAGGRGVARNGPGGHGVARNGVARAGDGPADDGRSQFSCVRKTLQVQRPVTGDRLAFASGSGRVGLAPGGEFLSHPGLAPGHCPREQTHHGDRQNQARGHRHDDGHGILEGPPGGEGHHSDHGQGGCGTTAATACVVKAWAAHASTSFPAGSPAYTDKPDVTVAGPGHRLYLRPAPGSRGSSPGAARLP